MTTAFRGFYVARGLLIPRTFKILKYEIEEAYINTERGPVYQIDETSSVVPFIYVIRKKQKESFQNMNQRAKDKVILGFCKQWAEQWNNTHKMFNI